jgi:hypothetical protein
VHCPEILHYFRLVDQVLAPHPSVWTKLLKVGAQVPEAGEDVRYEHGSDHALNHTQNGSFHLEGSRKPLQKLILASHFQNLKQPQNLHHSVQTGQPHKSDKLVVLGGTSAIIADDNVALRVVSGLVLVWNQILDLIERQNREEVEGKPTAEVLTGNDLWVVDQASV